MLTVIRSEVGQVGMVGDSQTGKTTLRDLYIDGEHDIDFKETLG